MVQYAGQTAERDSEKKSDNAEKINVSFFCHRLICNQKQRADVRATIQTTIYEYIGIAQYLFRRSGTKTTKFRDQIFEVSLSAVLRNRRQP